MKKKNKKIIIGILITLVILGILAYIGEIKMPLAVTSGFTPIFCNDYEFTCCNEKIDYSQNFKLSLKDALVCPSTATRCVINPVSWNVGTSPHQITIGRNNCQYSCTLYIFCGWKCDVENKYNSFPITMQPNDYVWYSGSSSGDVTVNNDVYKLRLDFCGKAGCTTGVPVLGADGCHFNPETGKVYTSASQLINAVSYTVPKDTCVLSFQSGDRHICGYVEETCSSDSDCGGHTYGNKECYGKTLQTYGCRSFGTPTPLERDRLPSESGWGVDSSQTIFGKRCEIISSQQVQCCGDTDCGVNYFCDRSTWTCKKNVQCSQDYDCGTSIQCDYTIKKLKKPVCSLGQCTFQETPVDCCSDVNCPTGYYCTAERKCAEKVAVCLECPYECCENQCEASGGYFDKICPSDRPYCVDNACKTEDQPDTYCESCDAYALSRMIGSIWKEKSCKPKLLQTTITCIVSFLKLLLIIPIFIITLLFGKDILSKFDALKRKDWLVWIFAVIIAVLISFLIFILFWIGILVLIGIIVFKIFFRRLR